MPLLKKKRVLAAATETTAYTAETLVAGDALFDAYDVMIQASIEGGQREAERVFGTRAAPGGARGGTATFKVDLKWDGTATLPNWATILVPACGYVNATGTLTPRSEAPGANVKTLTLGSYQDGMFKQLVGAAGTFRRGAVPCARRRRIRLDAVGSQRRHDDAGHATPSYGDPWRRRAAAAGRGGCEVRAMAAAAALIKEH